MEKLWGFTCKKWYFIGCFNQCQFRNQCFTFILFCQRALTENSNMIKIPLKREYLRDYEDSRETHSDKVNQHNEGYLNHMLYPLYHLV